MYRNILISLAVLNNEIRPFPSLFYDTRTRLSQGSDCSQDIFEIQLGVFLRPWLAIDSTTRATVAGLLKLNFSTSTVSVITVIANWVAPRQSN